jgi:transketolase
LSAALAKRPAVIAPFVTRPAEKVIDRAASGLSPATAAATGVYALRRAEGKRHGSLVLQGNDVGYAFVEQTLPLLIRKGIDLDVYYVASAELFDLLPAAEKERIYPQAAAQEALGITGFTLPTMERWVCSARGRSLTLHPFQRGRFLGSGQADKVLEEAGLDGESQFRAILRYVAKTPRPASKKKPAAFREKASKKKAVDKKRR